jgi:hypothetical protein
LFVDNHPAHWHNRGIPNGAFPNLACAEPMSRLLVSGEQTMAYAQSQLLAMSQSDLDALFSNSSSGDIPDGEAEGTAIIAPGTVYSSEIASLINIFVWQGKTFDSAHGTLRNRILPFGLNAIVAEVYKAPSLFDNKECLVLDYSKTSLVAEHIRDEIRQIGVGSFLGLVYWDKAKSIHFALQFPVA